MSIDREALEFISELGTSRVHEHHGEKFVISPSGKITHIPHEPPRPQPIKVTSLDSLVGLISKEVENFPTPTFVHIVNEREIEVFSTFDKADAANPHVRHVFYNVECDAPSFNSACWYNREDATIKLLSVFEDTEDKNYILDIISRLTQNNSVVMSDNGITQTIEMRSGVELKSSTQLKPIVSLKPFRTFLEVEQPESKFLFRVNEKGQIGFIEADGGMWVLEAKKNIAQYLTQQLKELIESGQVVMMI